MTRTIQCDVCGVHRDIINADDYFVLQIPHRNLEEEIDEPLVVDVCSLECLNSVVKGLNAPAQELEPETAPEPVRNGRLRPRPPQVHEQVTPGETHYEGEVTVR